MFLKFNKFKTYNKLKFSFLTKKKTKLSFINN